MTTKENKSINSTKFKFIKNPLSLIEGGSMVTIYFNDRISYYNSIKNTEAYISKVLRDSVEDIIAIDVNGVRHPLFKDALNKSVPLVSNEMEDDDLPF